MTARDAPSFRPIRVVHLDLDARGRVVELGAPGERVWVEAVRGGQVVGLLETRLDESHPEGVVDVVAAAFGDVEPGLAADVPDDALPSASVVVPTVWRRPDQLDRTVRSLLALDYPDFEVVLVDNRTRPDRPIEVADDPRLHIVAERTAGISSARNRGVEMSSGSIVAFTDDDAVVERGWLRALGARFALEPRVDALGGLVLPSELDTEAQLWFEEYYGGFSQTFRRTSVSLATEVGSDPLFPFAPGRFGAGCNMAFRRQTLSRLGGFDPALGTGTPAKGGEDLAIFIGLVRSGGTMGFEPGAVVRHSHRRTREEFLHQVRTYGTGLAAMYTSLVVRDRSTFAELARRVPAGIRLLTRPPESRSPSARPSYPRRALAYQVLGMALGPVAYARSRRAARRGAEVA